MTGRATSGGIGLATVLLASTALAGAAFAQDQRADPPPVRSTVDQNGVDLVTGAFNFTTVDVAIGPGSSGGLSYVRTWIGNGWRDNLIGTLDINGSIYTVSIGGGSERFTKSGSTYTSDQGSGSTLTFDGSQTYTYTNSTGPVAVFNLTYESNNPYHTTGGRIQTLTNPSGEKLTYHYNSTNVCPLGGCIDPVEPYQVYRVSSVTNNQGYQLKVDYPNNSVLIDPTLIPAWSRPSKVTGVNNAVEYCNPTATSCSLTTGKWPSAAYTAFGGSWTKTDALNRVTRYAYNGDNLLSGIRRPGSTTDDITIGYDASDRVSSIGYHSATSTTDSWTYTYSDAFSSRTTTVKNPAAQTVRTEVADLNSFLPFYDVDGVGRMTNYEFDSKGRLTDVTRTGMASRKFTYDPRGNVTKAELIGTGLTISASAAYDPACSNPKICNKPNTTTDARGYVTDYAYDSGHGGLTSVTLPAPSGSGIRPKTSYSYAAKFAYYKQSSGTGVTQAPTAVTKLTEVSACATSASCPNSADEVQTTVGYGATSAANNLLPVTTSSGSGDGALTATTMATWTDAGDLATIDGPLSGANDVATYRYDQMREMLGVIGPDPDTSGPLLRRAVRMAYASDGQVQTVERGTVTGTSDSAWAAFATLQTRTAGFDLLGRTNKDSLSAGGTTYSVTQYGYDSSGRLQCAAVRMNPAEFGSLPSDACALDTTGSFGPDRISKITYDLASEVTKVQTGVGVTGETRDMATYTYWPNERIKTLTDAEGHVSTFEYDDVDRLQKIRFPLTSGSGSSTTDYEQYTYDDAANVTTLRRRSNQTIDFSYDHLNRVTLRNPPGTANDVTYGYDLTGRMTSAATPVQTLGFTWDALGRNTSQTTGPRDVDYQYDLASRRTRLTWPDTNYVAYEYDYADDLTYVRENGATTGAGVLAVYTYDNLGQRTGMVRGNGATTDWTYDPASRLTSIAHDLAGSTNNLTLTLTYNPANQIATRTTSNDLYVFDKSTADVSYTSNGLNQYTAVGSVTPTYDSQGNLSDDGPVTYSFDALGRLSGAGSGGLDYDPLDRLEAEGGGDTHFLWDGADLIAEYDSSGVMTQRYAHGPGLDEPLTWWEGADLLTRRWHMLDERNSVVGVSKGNGGSYSINAYDEYGVPDSTNTGRFAYTGQLTLTGIPVYYYKAREYHPGWGRFLQPDPLLYDGGSPSLYAYVLSDPLNHIDPSGMDLKWDWVRTSIFGPAHDGYASVYGGQSWGGGGGGAGCLPNDPYGSSACVGSAGDWIITGRGTWRGTGIGPAYFGWTSVAGVNTDIGMSGGDREMNITYELSKPASIGTRLLQCAADQIGLSAAAGTTIAAGAGTIPKSVVRPGESRMTSVASVGFRALFGDTKFPFGARLPAPTVNTLLRGVVPATSFVGKFAGRAVPIAGWALTAYDVGYISGCAIAGR